MKKNITLLTCILTAVSMLSGCGSTQKKSSVEVSDPEYYQKFAGQGMSINVYNWGEYIADGSEADIIDVNGEFEALTGIKVNYTTYATNEELYAKMKGGGADYDIIIPSDYMIARMIKEDMLTPLDYSLIPNSEYIMDSFKNPLYDSGSAYSVPYTWGTVGIIYNKNYVDEEDIDWDILWDEKYSDKILMFDNPRDAFAIAELLLGYSLNTENPDELKAAANKLTEQKKLVQAYVMDEIFDKMGAEEAYLAPYYAGDAITLMNDYDYIDISIPKSGTNKFVDAICIPKTSQKAEAAHMYINFLMEPEIALANCEYIGYSTPHKEAYEMLDDEVKNNKISYPDEDYLENKSTFFANLSDDANQLMQDLWTSMKSSN
ncbi:MAG: spermidine/putrescine ABC transporter substrate-binding protein [Clostridia bacterium]|nr:spermidine/putrescine ABC transporter substrate-binding protein [Clostridia bacterium]